MIPTFNYQNHLFRRLAINRALLEEPTKNMALVVNGTLTPTTSTNKAAYQVNTPLPQSPELLRAMCHSSLEAIGRF